ncbi:MAG: hypothetical protein WD906_01185 [Anaerolineales bacterium]
MKRIFVPTRAPQDWKPLLAQPERHWKAGHSAMALAQCWESAAPGFPEEVAHAFVASKAPELRDLEMLVGLPEYEVALQGGTRASQTDLLVLAAGSAGLVCLAIEGKVEEAFGPTLGEKRKETEGGVPARLAQLDHVLGLQRQLPDTVRYQLVHRTVSAVLAARQFSAAVAVMIVHSFSVKNSWLPDFVDFAGHLGVPARPGELHSVPGHVSPTLFLGWCHGSPRFLSDLSGSAA